ncbi:phage protease [Streptosporangium roseum]|uniref:phage protease n=1 Tax=Streptosporangium roseum TaxID=2001 RepID=UPI000689B9E7|nr:phage protease [Streptosporangium roseum]
MPDLTVPAPPPLATVSNVELMHTGTWNLSTGPVTFSRDDLAQAVAALDCPAVRRPILKLGHLEAAPDENGLRWDGLPAVGYITNMAVAEAGRTLVGDYAGMPGWLGPIIASAYPDRSIEGQFDHRCQMGHLHPFVITAVSLLGIAAPGIGTLQSLQDVAALYGVAASTPPPPSSGEPIAVTVHATREDTVPNPRAPQIAAGVTTEDVRRAFYSSDFGRSWDIWIEAIELDPMQIIAIDDATGGRSRVPVVIGDGDGEAAVSFGDPVRVVVRYDDAPAVAAAADRTVRYGSRAESRPQASTPLPPPVQPETPTPATPVDPPIPAPPVAPSPQPVDPAAPETPPVEPGTTPNEGEAMPALDEGLRERLGLGADADEATILAAVDDMVDKVTTPDAPAPVAASIPEGAVLVDSERLAQLERQAAEGVAARAQQRTEARDRALDEAVKAGKFPPARREHYAKAWDVDPDGTKQLLASLADGLVPMTDIGAPGGEPTGPADDWADHLFSTPGKA